MMPLIIAYILNLVDYAFTSFWVHKYGITAEANPIGRWMFSNNIAWVFKIFVVGGLVEVLGVVIRKHPKAVIVSWILLAAFCLIVLYHISMTIYLLIKYGGIP